LGAKTRIAIGVDTTMSQFRREIEGHDPEKIPDPFSSYLRPLS
jgi:hypothetical protein